MSYENIRDTVIRAESLEREIESAKAECDYDEAIKAIERIAGMEEELAELKASLSPIGKKKRPAKRQAKKNEVQDAVLSVLRENPGVHSSSDVAVKIGPGTSLHSVKSALRRLANAGEIARHGKLGFFAGALPEQTAELTEA